MGVHNAITGKPRKGARDLEDGNGHDMRVKRRLQPIYPIMEGAGIGTNGGGRQNEFGLKMSW